MRMSNEPVTLENAKVGETVYVKPGTSDDLFAGFDRSKPAIVTLVRPTFIQFADPDGSGERYLAYPSELQREVPRGEPTDLLVEGKLVHFGDTLYLNEDASSRTLWRHNYRAGDDNKLKVTSSTCGELLSVETEGGRGLAYPYEVSWDDFKAKDEPKLPTLNPGFLTGPKFTTTADFTWKSFDDVPPDGVEVRIDTPMNVRLNNQMAKTDTKTLDPKDGMVLVRLDATTCGVAHYSRLYRKVLNKDDTSELPPLRKHTKAIDKSGVVGTIVSDEMGLRNGPHYLFLRDGRNSASVLKSRGELRAYN